MTSGNASSLEHRPYLNGMVQQALVVSDHALTRAGLSATLADEPRLTICGETDRVEAALQLLGRLHPDLLILDLSLRNGIGISLIQECKELLPRLKILVLSLHEEWVFAGQALKSGAMGYLNRSGTQEMVVDAVRNLLAGKMYLSPELTRQMLANGTRGNDSNPIGTLTVRERQVFELVGRGLTSQTIARSLKLSKHTVETYRERIKSKLNFANGAELTFRAIVWVLMHE